MKKSSKHWLYIGLALLFALMVWYYIGGRAVGTAKPWSWNRGDNEPVAKKPNGFTIFAGRSALTLSTSSGKAESSRENDGVDFSHFIVRPGSEHPLCVICAEKIAEKLKTIPAIKRIEFAPYGPLIRKDEPLPLWIVQVDADHLEEKTIPNRSLMGDIEVSFGTSFGAAAKRVASVSGGNGPLCAFAHYAKNDIHYTYTGICSQSVFYDKIAEEIAGNTFITIKSEIDRLSQSALTLPKLPEMFYPAYHEASAIPPMPGLVSQTILVDGRRLMLPHYSLTRIESNFAGTKDEFLTEVQQVMREDGWKESIRGIGLQLFKGTETIYLVKEKRGNGFLMERREWMDDASMHAAIQTLLDEHAPASALLIAANWVRDTNNATAQSLQEQVRTRLLDLKANTPAEQLALAEFFAQTGDTEIAKEMLFKAWQIRYLTPSPKSDSDYTTLAKKLKAEAEMKALPPLTAELCEECGFIRLTPENCPMEIDVDVNDETKFVTDAEEGYVALMQHKFYYENGALHTDSLQTTFRQHGGSQGNAKSSGTHLSLNLPAEGRGHFTFSVLSEPPPGSGKPIRMRIEFQR